MKKLFFLLLSLVITLPFFAQEIALLKYNGGGDWYANPTALPNLVKFCNSNIKTNLNTKIPTVEVGNSTLLSYPFVHMTGHGNVEFSDSDIQNLKKYLTNGGFLHIDDNYGMDKYVRREIKKLFPNENLVEIGKNHPIFSSPYKFENGLPKIHEHDNKAPQAFGIIIENRIVLLYTYETDLGDGWESPEVHNNSESTRQKALQMGANIINYAFTN